MNMDSEHLYQFINSSKALRLLYVEDDTKVRFSTLEFFNMFFKNITVCNNGQEGLNAFSKKVFDLIITDINMPYINGLEMVQTIRKTDTEIPIFILSGQSDTNSLSTLSL